MHPPPSTQEQGFTLMETLLSLLLGSLCMLGFLNFQRCVLRQSERLHTRIMLQNEMRYAALTLQDKLQADTTRRGNAPSILHQAPDWISRSRKKQQAILLFARTPQVAYYIASSRAGGKASWRLYRKQQGQRAQALLSNTEAWWPHKNIQKKQKPLISIDLLLHKSTPSAQQHTQRLYLEHRWHTRQGSGCFEAANLSIPLNLPDLHTPTHKETHTDV